jgi:Xaa-Pro aminopeptidase
MAAETSSAVKARREGLRAIMRARDLAAIVIIGGTNLNWFSGFAGVERSMARPMLFVLPREGEPVMVAHRFRTHLIAAHSPVVQTIFYDRLSRAPVDAFLEALRLAGAAQGRIGFELGGESQMFMSYGDFDALRDAVGCDRIVDVGADVWRLRYVRTADELAAQRTASELATQLIAECWDHAEEGMRQGDLTAFVQRRVLETGCSAHYAIVSAGAENYDFCGAWTPDYRFRRGDMVWIDLGVQKGGWCAAYSRAATVGPASDDQRRVTAEVAAATADGVAACGPGVPVADVARVCAEALAVVDAPVTSDIAAFGTRFGHGMGLEFIEPPHIAPYDDTVLAPGMVLAVEPGIATAFGRFHFRQLVAVTDNGRECLPAPDMALAELRIAGQDG